MVWRAAKNRKLKQLFIRSLIIKIEPLVAIYAQRAVTKNCTFYSNVT